MNDEAKSIETVITRRTLDAMERWARWRWHGGTGSGMAFGGSGNVLGRLQGSKRWVQCGRCVGKGRVPIPGMNTHQRCPRCKGARKVFEDLQPIARTSTRDCELCRVLVEGKWCSTGEINGRTCHKCRGAKFVVETERHVHPATIAGTRWYGRQDPDPLASRINLTVIAWKEHNATYWMHRVVIEWYNGDGATQEQKAARMDVSQPWFAKNLKLALLRIQWLIENGGWE
jgi:hypothetical protein